jgi:2-oxoisovalerate dehydrogenase E1 component alpha subunit
MTSDDGAVIARFEIRRRAYLGPEGDVRTSLPGFATPPSALIPLYEAMVLNRAFDARAVVLQRTGRLGTYASLGQEAVSVGVASAMEVEDVLLVSYRESGALLWRGVTMGELLLYWGGDERGSNFSGPKEDFPICIPVGTQAAHAAGVAYAFKLRRQKRVAVCIFGDGATSKGDVSEAMNFAGVHHLPVVYIVNDNRWAISVPRRLQTAAATYAQKAIAAGIPSEQVDGNDAIAVRQATAEAIARARQGDGPSLIDAQTYRLGDHTTADDARRYRPDDEVKAQWKFEPIGRLRTFLVSRGAWSKGDEEMLITKCQQKVEAAAERYLSGVPRAPETMFDQLYADLPKVYRRQRQELADNRDA